MAAKRASLITYFDVLQGAVKMMSDFLGDTYLGTVITFQQSMLKVEPKFNFCHLNYC